jgi:hypothetical protein
MFEAHLDLRDLSATDPDREQKVLSRCLAAVAIYLQTGCTEKEAAEAVWDGGDDNGIDARFSTPLPLRYYSFRPSGSTRVLENRRRRKLDPL